jgi:enoyl-CoA hydratase/carnithine racemase
MSDQSLLIDRDGPVLRLTLNRPQVRNALDAALIAGLTTAFTDLREPGEVRVAVLTGAGDKAFCAGADLSPEAQTFGFDYAAPTTAYADLLRAGRAASVPILARINGHCLAGGMGLLALADMAVASTQAKFGLPEVKVGMFPMQVAALLQPLLPRRIFREMCFTGELLTADDALRCGLVSRVVDGADLDAIVDQMVARIVAASPSAIRRGKYALNATDGMTPEQAVAFLEGQIGLLSLTEDAREGLAAFAEKRPPRWTGR